MLTVACVENSNYLGRGQEYVAKLQAMVARNLSVPHEFVCLTDDPARHPGVHTEPLRMRYPGWWAKVEMWRPNTFTGRVLYLDLDTVVTGPLDQLVQRKGILHLTDWGWKNFSYGSGVMVWDAGEHVDIWDKFTLNVTRRFRGDQDYLTELGGWDALPFPACCSYRYHAIKAPPPGAVTVSFHGLPKVHDVQKGWVPGAWC